MHAADGFDAVVVGSGPNGLAAAITIARGGCRVLVLEANATIGGGVRSAELTLPGFVHDACSSIHPLGIGSPFFRQLPLAEHGLEWVHPDVPLAHPLELGDAAVLSGSVAETAAGLAEDEGAYRRLMLPFVEHWPELAQEILQPLLHFPKSPRLLWRFVSQALRPASALAATWFKTQRAQALLAGMSAHSGLPLEQTPSASVGLVLGALGHAVGWPMPRGGARKIAEALAAYLRSLGGQIETNCRVADLRQVPRTRAVLLDVTPRQFLRMAGDRLPSRYRSALERFQYGPGTFKLDYALAAPIPWLAPACARAGTIHLGGPLAEVSLAERQVGRGEHPERPFVLLAQHTLFDPTRAPAGLHTAWAYCHVPHGSTFDMSARIEAQIERFAPGFRERVLARHVLTSTTLEAGNSNLVGGDINGGLANLRQILGRPVLRLNPYRTPLPGVYLCSASTPPGGGVHGMCGYHAARTALAERFSSA